MLYKCLCCNMNYQKMVDKNVKKRVLNVHKFSNHDTNKFILLLQKCVYPYKCVNDWKRFNEISLPGKQNFSVT